MQHWSEERAGISYLLEHSPQQRSYVLTSNDTTINLPQPHAPKAEIKTTQSLSRGSQDVLTEPEVYWRKKQEPEEASWDWLTGFVESMGLLHRSACRQCNSLSRRSYNRCLCHRLDPILNPKEEAQEAQLCHNYGPPCKRL